MKLEEALLLADGESETTKVLAAEVKRLRAAFATITETDNVIVSTHVDGYGVKYRAIATTADSKWLTQPASRLGFNCSGWGGVLGHDYFEIHWPDRHPFQMMLKPDAGEIYGFLKIEQDAINHWTLRRA